MNTRFLIHQLFEIGAVKFGQFTLKSGVVSPFYIDLRLSISYPKLLQALAEAMFQKVQDLHMSLICGVPYTAMPFATAISLQHNIPLLMCRKERKAYGTKKQVEGVFQKKERCLVIEDVITSGQSIFETIGPLQEEGLIVNDIALIVDREQGGRQYIESKGFHVHPVCTITMIIQELLHEGKIDERAANAVYTFIQNNQTPIP